MAYYSLVVKATNTVTQIVDSPEKRFDTHEDFIWIEGPDEYDNIQGYQLNTETGKIEIINYGAAPYREERVKHYNDPGVQFDKLWHDMDQGIIPGKDTSEWYKHIKSVKEMIPKN